jgi:hypothetical protein
MSSATTLVELSPAGPRPARDDVHVARARVLDTSAWFAFRYDPAEAARRAGYQLGPVLAWDLLDVLMDLPTGLAVPVRALHQQASAQLRRAPAGIVRFDEGHVIRDLVPAVSPLLVVVCARGWKAGMIRASRFAPYCRRIVVGPAGGATEALAVAARLGIGVAARADGPAQVLLEPQPVRDWQPTTAWWRFCEAIYAGAGWPAG